MTENNRPACPICFMPDVVYLCEANHYPIQQCKHCEVDFVWPKPDKNKLVDYYNNQHYFEGGEEGAYVNYDQDTEHVLPLFKLYIEQFPASKESTILDIGCAYGTHLAIASDLGFTAWGVEISTYARNVAQQRHHKKINVVANVNELPSTPFDLIILLDVIEHISDPYALFFELFRQGCIGKNTSLMITTPNARSVDAIANPSKWLYRCPPAHLTYYSAKALNALFSLLGARHKQIEGIYYSDINNSETPTSGKKRDFNTQLMQYSGLFCVIQDFKLPKPIYDVPHSFEMIARLQAINLFNKESELHEQKRCLQSKNEQQASLEKTLFDLKKLTDLKQNELEQKVAHILSLTEDQAFLEKKQDHLNALIVTRENELADKNQQISELFNTKCLAEKHCVTLSEKISTLENTYWYKLGVALQQNKFNIKNWMKITYYAFSCVAPASLRVYLLRLAHKTKLI